MNVYVSAIFKSKFDYASPLKKILFDLVNNTRIEKACLQCDLYQSIENENVFIIREEWLEYSWFDFYIQQQYVKDFNYAAKNYLEKEAEFYLIEKMS